MALDFQTAGHRLLTKATTPLEVRAALQESYAELAHATCLSQEWDTRESASKEDY